MSKPHLIMIWGALRMKVLGSSMGPLPSFIPFLTVSLPVLQRTCILHFTLDSERICTHIYLVSRYSLSWGWKWLTLWNSTMSPNTTSCWWKWQITAIFSLTDIAGNLGWHTFFLSTIDGQDRNWWADADLCTFPSSGSRSTIHWPWWSIQNYRCYYTWWCAMAVIFYYLLWSTPSGCEQQHTTMDACWVWCMVLRSNVSPLPPARKSRFQGQI